MKPTSRPALRVLRCLVATAFLGAAAAYANDNAEIADLLKQNKPAEALSEIESRLSSSPKDPQLRFLQGVAQAMANKNKEAIDTFTKLTQEYPELPEPYNNLAVLYANQNQLDKSRQALEQAIRTNPSYSTAHENLGDIYAKLASQAYSKALQLDGSNANSLKPKLSLIHDLFSATPVAVAAAPKPAEPAVVVSKAEPAPPQPAPVPPPAPELVKPAEQPIVQPSPAPAAPILETQPVAQPEPKPEPPPAPKPARQPAATAAGKPEAAVAAWAQAWAAKDMNAYIGAYSPNFRPAGGQARAAWEKERHARIVGKKSITVQLSDMKVKVDGNKASVAFYQQYRADGFKANTRKTLQLEQRQGKWLIVNESTGG